MRAWLTLHCLQGELSSSSWVSVVPGPTDIQVTLPTCTGHMNQFQVNQPLASQVPSSCSFTWKGCGSCLQPRTPGFSLHFSMGGHFSHLTDETTMAQRQLQLKAQLHSQGRVLRERPGSTIVSPCYLQHTLLGLFGQQAGTHVCLSRQPEEVALGSGGFSQHT